MLTYNMSKSELIKETRRYYKNLKSRIKNVEKLNLSASRQTVKQFREFEKRFPKKLSKLPEKDIRTLYRDVRYLNSLKTSTVKGAKFTQEKFEPIREKLNALSKSKQEKFWEIYNKLYEITSTMEHFKYELFDTNIDYIYGGEDVDKAVKDIIEQYNTTLEELGGEASDEEIKLLFTSRLQDIFK